MYIYNHRARRSDRRANGAPGEVGGGQTDCGIQSQRVRPSEKGDGGCRRALEGKFRAARQVAEVEVNLDVFRVVDHIGCLVGHIWVDRRVWHERLLRKRSDGSDNLLEEQIVIADAGTVAAPEKPEQASGRAGSEGMRVVERRADDLPCLSPAAGVGVAPHEPDVVVAGAAAVVGPEQPDGSIAIAGGGGPEVVRAKSGLRYQCRPGLPTARGFD